MKSAKDRLQGLLAASKEEVTPPFPTSNPTPYAFADGDFLALEVVGVAARVALGIATLPVDELEVLIGAYRSKLLAFDAWCAAAADPEDAQRLREATARQIAALRATLAGNRTREGQP